MFDCCHEPERRKRPEWCGPADTTPVGNVWDHQPECKPCPCPPFPDSGYCLNPLPCTIQGMNTQEQLAQLNCKMNEIVDMVNKYSCDVYGAYTAIVNSALCNDAYYNEITTEEGYIAEASAKYKVIHIPFLDRAKEPIYFELGLAYNNTTNANVHEDVFNASQRTIADKLIPAYNSDNTWVGAVVWKGAPIGNIGELPAAYTFGVTDNGFFKVYENLTDYTQLKQDCVRNAFEARSILIQGGNLTPDKFEPDEKNQQLGRVGVGMNYDTKERFIVIVQGSNQSGCTTEQLANIFKTYNCNMAVELSNGMMTTALDKGAFMFVPPTADGVSVPTIPEVNAFWYITKRRHYHNEYVRDVANLTQKYGEMLWRTETANISVDNVKAVVAGFQRALETETTERKAADETLQANINAEAEAREQGDTTLQQNINTLSQHVDEVQQELTQADATLQQNIDNLRTELTAKDIASVEKTADSTKNIYRIRLNNTNYVDVAIETYDYSMLTQKLDTLSALEPRLEAEVTARQTVDARIEAKADTNTADIANLKTEKVNKAGDTMTGNLDMQQHTVTNLKDPVNETDAVTLKYFNDNKGDTSGQYLPTAGGTMTGNLDMGNNKVVNLADPTADGDAVNKKYFEAQVPQIIESNLAGDNSPIGEAIDGRLVFHLVEGTTQKDLYDAYVNGAKFIIQEAEGYSVLCTLVEFDDNDDGTYRAVFVGADRGSSPVCSGTTIEGNKTSESAITDVTNYKLLTGEARSNYNAGGAKITNLEAPDTDTDAANKAYVDATKDELNGLYLPKAGGAMSGNIDMKNNRIFDVKELWLTSVPTEEGEKGAKISTSTSGDVQIPIVQYVEFSSGSQVTRVSPLIVAAPTENSHAANKRYVDSKIAQAGGGDFMASGAVPMTGDLNMDNHKIVAVSDPTDSTDGANKHYVDNAVTQGITGAQFLPLAGGTLTGPLTLAGEPSAELQAATKKYVDNTVAQGVSGAQFLPLSGGTVTGATTFSGAVTVIAPTADMNPATKAYTDSKIQELQSALDTANDTISTLQSELSTAKGNITTLQSQVSTLNTFMNKFQPMLNTIYNG